MIFDDDLWNKDGDFDTEVFSQLCMVYRTFVALQEIPPEVLISLAYLDEEDDDFIDSFYELCRFNWYGE